MDRNTEPEYRRYTAVLREDKRNYAITPAKRPRGKVVIEIHGNKGVFKCLLKNLRLPRNEGNFSGYAVWLVNEEKDKTIPVYAGTTLISEEGVGESTWNFTADNVRNTGLDIDSFNIVEVRVATARQDVSGDRVLVGHLELEEVNLSGEPKMEKVSPFGTGLPYYQWWKFYPGFFYDWMYYPSVSVNSYRPRGVPVQPSHQIYGGFENNNQPVLQACSDEFKYVQTGPVFRGHQLIGLQYDQKGAVKFLVHGIPGRFCLRDQPYGGATGYVYWHPLPGQQYKAGDYGYWLIHIDPHTGEVVFPQRETKPPDCEQCNREE